MAGVKGRSGPPGNKNRWVHGVHGYRKLLEGSREHEIHTELREALQEKEKELATALGGDPSPQEKILIQDTVKNLLYVGGLDAFLATRKRFVYKGKPHAVLSTRTELAGHIRRNLQLLGLKRVTKSITLEDVLNGDADHGTENETPAS